MPLTLHINQQHNHDFATTNQTAKATSRILYYSAFRLAAPVATTNGGTIKVGYPFNWSFTNQT